MSACHPYLTYNFLLNSYIFDNEERKRQKQNQHTQRIIKYILRSSQRCVVFIYRKAPVAKIRVVVQTGKKWKKWKILVVIIFCNRKITFSYKIIMNNQSSHQQKIVERVCVIFVLLITIMQIYRIHNVSSFCFYQNLSVHIIMFIICKCIATLSLYFLCIYSNFMCYFVANFDKQNANVHNVPRTVTDKTCKNEEMRHFDYFLNLQATETEKQQQRQWTRW